MGQQEVYDILKRNKGKWLSANEITKLMTVPSNNATSNLKRLRNGGIIKGKKVVMAVKTNGEGR